MGSVNGTGVPGVPGVSTSTDTSIGASPTRSAIGPGTTPAGSLTTTRCCGPSTAGVSVTFVFTVYDAPDSIGALWLTAPRGTAPGTTVLLGERYTVSIH